MSSHAWRLAAVLFVALAPLSASAADPLVRTADWTPPAPAEVRARMLAWAGERELTEPQRLGVEALWPAEGGPAASSDLLAQAVATFALCDPALRPLVTLCSAPPPDGALPDFPFLTDPARRAWETANLRLAYACWLSQHARYDEALGQLAGLDPAMLIDPAAARFHAAVAHHALLQKDACLAAAGELLANEAVIPRRYAVVARLLEADLAPLEPDSLDEIARLMDDVRRRLNFGRAGTRVRTQEDEVVAKLDKLIEELEQQQQQQQAAAGAGQSPSQPAPDSLPGGGSGPGDVDPRRLAGGKSWGDLPPKEREEALQEIGQDLPGYFRDAIEEYFRKLAREGE